MDKQTFLGLIQQRKSKGIDYSKSLCTCDPDTGCCQYANKLSDEYKQHKNRLYELSKHLNCWKESS